MTSVQFEAATIIDVITRANKAAPRVSSNTERFAGIVLDIQPAANYAVVRSTNEDVFYREIVDIIEASGERAIWRVSSVYLTQIIQTFRSRSGDIIDFADNGGQVEITQLRKKAKIGKMRVEEYPSWFETDAADAETVTDIGNAMKLVDWAGDSNQAALGIRITKTHVYATDRYVMARFPVAIEKLAHPVTLQLGMFDGLIPVRGDIRMKVIGGQILFMPNERTQIRGATIGEAYPNIEKAMDRSYDQSFTVTRDELTTLIKSTSAAADSGQGSMLRLFIGGGCVAGVLEHVDDPSTGMRDIIDVNGAEHDLHEICFNPNFLSKAVSHCPDERITFHYSTGKFEVIKISSASGYEAWVSPIKPPKRSNI